MNIIDKRDAGKLTVALEGRLDTTTAPSLDAYLVDGLRDVNELVLDFKALEYVSSAGLRVILKASKIMATQGKMKVTGANESIMEVFDITGFSEILDIE